VVVSRLDQSLLMQVASLTGGKFQFATPGEEEIDRIGGEVAGMDRQQLQSKLFLRSIDRFQVPLFLAILLLLWETIFTDQVPKRSLPRRWGVLKIFLVGFFLFHFFPGAALADQKLRRNAAGNRYFKEKNYDGALREYVEAQDGKKYSQELSYNIANTLYQQKKYAEAIKEYEKAWSASHSEWNQKVFFNQGNAFFQSGDFSRAVDSYRKALELNPADQDAKHNLELALEKLQAQQNNNQPNNQKQNQNQPNQPKQNSGQEKKQENQQDNQQDNRQNQKQSQDRDQKEQKPPDSRDSKAQSKPKEGMDPREAKKILEAFENQEKKEQRQQNRQLKQGTIVGKDW
jgi:Ca-activated chloride channel family protein